MSFNEKTICEREFFDIIESYVQDLISFYVDKMPISIAESDKTFVDNVIKNKFGDEINEKYYRSIWRRSNILLE